MDSGYAMSRAMEIQETKCSFSSNGKHEWIIYSPNSPSTWGKCENCGITWYYK